MDTTAGAVELECRSNAALAREHSRGGGWPDPCLVLEGSAILPEMVCASGLEGCRAVWLTASGDFLRERIRASSGYSKRSSGERKWIDAFIERTLEVDRIVVESADRLGQRCLDVTASNVGPELLRTLQSDPGGV